jgi:hypothetical protein
MTDVSTPFTSEADLHLAVTKLARQSLEQYQGVPACGNAWLSDYKITQLARQPQLENATTPYVFQMTYAVKPAWAPSYDGYWIAGNGTQTTDSWIEGKLTNLYLAKENNLFTADSSPPNISASSVFEHTNLDLELATLVKDNIHPNHPPAILPPSHMRHNLESSSDNQQR